MSTATAYAPKGGTALAPLAPPPMAETAGMVLAAQAKALVEARYLIAMRQPRDIDAVFQRMERECARPAFADVAIYHKPVGDGIEGPSIRLAEALAAAMGNLLIESPTIYDDQEKRIMRVTVADMETNVAYSKDVTVMKRVERSRLGDGQVALRQRTNSRGRIVYMVEATDDEILNTENALVSKTLRTLLLRVVPGWLLEECMRLVRATREKANAQDPDAAKRKLFSAFASVGISVEQVKEWLGHDGERLQPKEREELLGLYTAIKDGDTTWREVMDARDPKDTPAQQPADKSPGAAQPDAPPKEAQPKEDPAQANAGSGEAAAPQLSPEPVEADPPRRGAAAVKAAMKKLDNDSTLPGTEPKGQG